MLPGAEQAMVDGRQNPREHAGLTLLICLHTVTCCISLVYVAHFQGAFHIFYDPARAVNAIAVVAVFAIVSCVFTSARFSFGYQLGFYFYTMIVGYLWINTFSDLDYDHRLAGLSAAASAIAFLLPAVLITSPVRRTWVMTRSTFDRVLTFIVVLSAATIPVGAAYNFRLVSLGSIYEFRDQLQLPRLLNYGIGITSSALLPFAFACFVLRGNRWRASLSLLIMLLFYPVTLSKLTFFTPLWLLTITLLSRIFETRTAAILSLFLPVLAGVILIVLLDDAARPYFDLVNFRMVAVPSSAMDIYNDFFRTHDLTYFCQITFLKRTVGCAYDDQLSVVLNNIYHLGNFNASLFATEGVASTGVLFAPLAAFACGLVIALANRLSAGLPPRFILISGAILPQAFLNVPMTTVLLTHGAGLLFLLWYITPRTMFEPRAAGHSSGLRRGSSRY